MRVIILLVVIVAAVFVVHAAQGERTAVLPIRVWMNLVDAPEYQCWILPLQGYTGSGWPMYVDVVKHPNSHGWYNVAAGDCRGVALVGR